MLATRWLVKLVLLSACLVAVSLMAAEPLVIPKNGTSDQRFADLEQIVLDYRELSGATAATLTIAQDGKLVLSRSFGWRDTKQQTPSQPDDLFRIASVTKPITAALIYHLIRQQQLRPEANVADLLELTPPQQGFDPRWQLISVQHLLDHRGGWDRAKAGDPIFQLDKIQRALELKRNLVPMDIVQYQWRQPLQFEPGQKYVYSNFGYCLLGRVIEKTTGKDYLTSLTEALLKPAKITDLQLAKRDVKNRPAREVEYGNGVDSFDISVMDSHGGLIASGPALAQFFARYWINGQPREAKQQQNWLFYGSLPNTTAVVRQHLGWDVIMLYNGRRNLHYNKDHQQLKEQLDQAIKQLR